MCLLTPSPLIRSDQIIHSTVVRPSSHHYLVLQNNPRIRHIMTLNLSHALWSLQVELYLRSCFGLRRDLPLDRLWGACGVHHLHAVLLVSLRRPNRTQEPGRFAALDFGHDHESIGLERRVDDADVRGLSEVEADRQLVVSSAGPGGLKFGVALGLHLG